MYQIQFEYPEDAAYTTAIGAGLSPLGMSENLFGEKV
jgi:hypothetical protein